MDFGRFRARVQERLAHIDRSEAYLARQLGYSAGQFGKWMAGTNRLPYDAALAICEKLEFPPLLQSEMMALAGYPLPRWARAMAIHETTLETGSAAPDTPIEVRELHSMDEVYAYMQAAISSARHSVDDLTWGIDVPSHSEEDEASYLGYLQSISAACRRGVTFREVMSFRNSPHFGQRAEDMLSQNLMRYNLRYYDFNLREIPPMLSICIIDKNEAIIGGYRWPHLPVEFEKQVAVKHPAIVALFSDFFATIWHSALPIKDGDRVDWAELQRAISGAISSTISSTVSSTVSSTD